MQLNDLVALLKVGDILSIGRKVSFFYIFNSVDYHYAAYIGNRTVAHISDHNQGAKTQNQKRLRAMLTDIDEFIEDSTKLVVEYGLLPIKSNNNIIQQAASDAKYEYGLFQNCERYARKLVQDEVKVAIEFNRAQAEADAWIDMVL